MFDFIGKIQIFGFKLGVQVHYEALQKIVILRWLARGKDQGHRGKFRICLSTDKWLFKEGSNATYFFSIVEGHAEIVKNGYVIRNLGSRGLPWEMALLYGISFSARFLWMIMIRNFLWLHHGNNRCHIILKFKLYMWIFYDLIIFGFVNVEAQEIPNLQNFKLR